MCDVCVCVCVCMRMCVCVCVPYGLIRWTFGYIEEPPRLGLPETVVNMVPNAVVNIVPNAVVNMVPNEPFGNVTCPYG